VVVRRPRLGRGVDDPDEFEIPPTPERLPGLLFVPVDEAKTSKNGLHIDLRPDDQEPRSRDCSGLGATHADVWAGDETWIVCGTRRATSSAC
jgi:hypothetical protein